MFSSMLSLLGSLRRGNFVTNSLRFRSSASAYLSRTFSAPTNQNVWTYSAWVKRGTLAVFGNIGPSTVDANNNQILFNNDDTFGVILANTIYIKTTQVFRDSSAWYHIVLSVNSGAIGVNKMSLYVNGAPVTAFSTDARSLFLSSTINAAIGHNIGRYASSAANYFDGYLTEVNFIDGQALTPSSFGQIESTTGVWSPKQYVGSYGTNGFYLKFADASAATAAAIGKDSSGNGNNWTPSGISVTAGATYDSMIDVPVNYSDSGNGRGNYAVLNPLIQRDAGYTTSITDANLATSITYVSGANMVTVPSTISTSNSGKWYFEVTATSTQTAGGSTGVGISTMATTPISAQLPQNSYIYVGFNGNKASNTGTPTTAAYGATYTTNDVIGVAVDLDAGTLTFYKNNVSQGVAYTGIAADNYFPIVSSNASGTRSYVLNCGQRSFAYTPPAGFRALNTNNLPTPSIVNGANFMAATTYIGNASARSLSNAVNSVSFQPDLVWIKSRTPGATSHALFDSVRGTTKYLSSDTTAAETTLAQSLTAFGADGFSLGTDTTLVNANANSYIAWQWKESITAGLDVVSYTGTGVDRTVAHNLGVAPAMIIVKRSQTGATSNWQVRHTSITAANSIQLNSTNQAAAATTVWASTVPTSSVFTVGTSTDVNASGISYVAYCFAEIAGFSRFGSYTGNGSADGPFVFCGFRPRFVMIKRTDVGGVSGYEWFIYDTTRNQYNLTTEFLDANYSGIANQLSDGTTDSTRQLDILANGFKVRYAGASHNATGGTYIFAAFAEVPSKYALAR